MSSDIVEPMRRRARQIKKKYELRQLLSGVSFFRSGYEVETLWNDEVVTWAYSQCAPTRGSA